MHHVTVRNSLQCFLSLVQRFRTGTCTCIGHEQKFDLYAYIYPWWEGIQDKTLSARSRLLQLPKHMVGNPSLS